MSKSPSDCLSQSQWSKLSRQWGTHAVCCNLFLEVIFLLLGRQYTQGRTTQECEFQEVGIDGTTFGIWLSHSMGHRPLRLSLGLGWGPKLFLASSQMMLTLRLEDLWSIPYSHFCTSWIGISQTWEKGGKWKNTHKKYLSSLLYVLDTR